MICSECDADKLPENFYLDNSRPRGRVARCKDCYSKRQRLDRGGPRRRYSEAMTNATRRGLAWKLSYQQFVDWIWDGECFYCGEAHSKGIDRFNNEPYYDMTNAVTCCGPCNHMKSSLTFHDFISRVERIADRTLGMTANAAIALGGQDL